MLIITNIYYGRNIMHNIEAVFFDLFFTLVIPKYHLSENENDVLGLSVEEWESYAENEMMSNGDCGKSSGYYQ
jgi:hypothetical protein